MRRAQNADTHTLKQHRPSQNISPVCSSFVLVIASDMHLELESEKRAKNVDFHSAKNIQIQATFFAIFRRILRNWPPTYLLYSDHRERTWPAGEATRSIVFIVQGAYVTCKENNSVNRVSCTGRVPDLQGQQLSQLCLLYRERTWPAREATRSSNRRISSNSMVTLLFLLALSLSAAAPADFRRLLGSTYDSGW